MAQIRLGVITASEVHNVIAKPAREKWPDMKMSYFHPAGEFAPVSEVNAKTGRKQCKRRQNLFEFTSGVNITESRSSIATKVCAPPLSRVYAVTATAELKCGASGFREFRLGGFEAIKSAYGGAVQHVGDADAVLYNYDRA